MKSGISTLSHRQHREGSPASARLVWSREVQRLAASCCTLTLLVVAPGFSAPAETNNAALQDFSAFKIIIDRNIFDPDRHPRVVAGQAPTIVDSFTLVGTMSYQKGVFAVFDGTSSEYRKVLQSGGAIAGYTVKAIRQDTARIAAGTNELELSVGMQMRRNEDGRWSIGEPGESFGTSSSNISRRRETGRPANSNLARAGSRSGSRSAASPGEPGAAGQVDNGPDAGAPPPPEATSSDPNDPITRMMARRLLETGGSTSGAQSGNEN